MCILLGSSHHLIYLTVAIHLLEISQLLFSQPRLRHVRILARVNGRIKSRATHFSRLTSAAHQSLS